MIPMVLLLSACSTGVQPVEQTLNQYALAATNRAELPKYLTGSALVSAIESLNLIEQLGLISRGWSSFSDTKQVSSGNYSSCLDVSEARFFVASGDELKLDRLERQLVIVKVVDDKIADLRLEASAC